MEKTNSYTFKGFKATNEDFRQCLRLNPFSAEKGHSNGRKISRKPKYYYQ